MMRVVILAGLLFSVLAATPAAAGWRAWLGLGTDSPRAAPTVAGLADLEAIAGYIKSHVPADVPALGAHASAVGHWTLINRHGERFTAASPNELKTALATLFPGRRAEGRAPAFYLTEETVATSRHLEGLPAGSRLLVLAGGHAARLDQYDAAGSRMTIAQARPNLFMQVAERAALAEMIGQFNRPFDRVRLRVLAVDTEGSTHLSPSPRLDPAGRRALVDVVVPDALTSAFGSLRGQTAVLVGRKDGDQIIMRLNSGEERRYDWRTLMTAAEGADMNLIMLQTANPVQPVGSNWLWRPRSLRGLEADGGVTNKGDLLVALFGGSRTLLAIPVSSNEHQARLEIRVAPEIEGINSNYSRIADKVSELVGELAGKPIPSGAIVALRSNARQSELDARIIAAIPSRWQFGYMLAFVAGLIGAPVSRRWWGKIWTAETREDYEGVRGYWAAKALRETTYWLIFAPLAAVFAAPANLVKTVALLVGRAFRAIRRSAAA